MLEGVHARSLETSGLNSSLTCIVELELDISSSWEPLKVVLDLSYSCLSASHV